MILTPEQDNATFRIMPYAKINPKAAWRILVGPYTSLPLQEMMTLVVCKFDDRANEFLPIRRLRLPQNVPPNPQMNSTRDWKGYRFTAIGDDNSVVSGEVNQHIRPEVQISDEKSVLQPSGQAKKVDKWISTGVPRRDSPAEGHPQMSTAQGSTSQESEISEGLTDGANIPATHVRKSSPPRPRSKKGPRYSVIQPDGSIIPYQQARLQDLTRLKNLSRTPAMIEFAESRRKDRKLKESLGILPSRTHFDQQGGTSDTDPLSFPSSRQYQRSPSTARSPTRSHPPAPAPLPPVTPGASGSHSNTRPQGGRSVDSVIEELKNMMERSRKFSEEKPTPPRQITDESQSKSRPATIAEAEEHPTSLLDLDCEAISLADESQRLTGFAPLIPVTANNQSEITEPSHDLRWKGKAPAREEANSIFDGPNVVDAVILDNSSCFQAAPDLSALRSPTTSAPGEPVYMDFAAVSPLGSESKAPDLRHESTTPTSKQTDEQGFSRKLNDVAMEYLQRHIKESLGPTEESLSQESLDIEQLPPTSSGSQGDVLPLDLSTRQPGSSPRSVPQQDICVHGEERVAVLREDVIDVSPQSLSAQAIHCSLQHSIPEKGEENVAPGIREELATTEETQTREFHETMFHQRPCASDFHPPEPKAEARRMEKQQVDLDASTSEVKDPTVPLWKRRVNVITINCWKRRREFSSTGPTPAESQATGIKNQKTIPLLTEPATKSSQKKKPIPDASVNLFSFLRPSLDAARSFPGKLSLEIQFGLMFLPSLPLSIRAKEMNYREVHRLFFPPNDLKSPPVSMFERMTTNPADIDYLIDLKVNQSRLFESNYSDRGIKYEFWCTNDLKSDVIVSVNEHGHALIHYPEVSLGTVHFNFPSQVWDAAASVRGIIKHTTGADPEFDQAVQAMVKSIRVEPNHEQLRMAVRFPATSKIKIEQVVMKRWSRHPYLSNKSKDLFIQITEVQELLTTPSVLDADITVVQNAPLDTMVRDGKQWWHASIGSTSIEKIFKSNDSIMPGECSESWCPTDLLGTDFADYVPTTGDQSLSPNGAEVGDSGIGEMLQLAKTVVENIDAIGYWNKGPAAFSYSKRSASSKQVSSVNLSTTSLKPSNSQVVVPWVAPVKANIKRKW